MVARGPNSQGKTGAASCVLRIVGCVPTLMAGVRTFDHWKLLRHHPELGHAPYNPHTITSQYAAAVGGILCFIWAILTILPTMYGLPSMTFVVGCGDFAFAVIFIVASGLQGSYIPHTKGVCREAKFWQVPSGTPSLFQAISNFPGNDDSAQVICEEYFTTWCFLVSMAVVWALSATLALLFGAAFTEWKACHFKYLWIGPIHLLRIICCPLRPWIPHFYYLMRYTHKCFRRARCRYESSSKLQMWPRKRRRSGSEIGLARMLTSGQPIEAKGTSEKVQKSDQKHLNGAYDVLKLISCDLHHIDVINLSLVSKRVHKAIFPSSSREDQSERLRLFACEKGTKTICWACNTQICPSCKSTRLCGPTKSALHLTRCRAFCSSCLCLKIRQTKPQRGQCECIPRTFDRSFRPSSYFTYSWTRSPKLFANGILPQDRRDICRACDKLSTEELVARRDRREADTVKQLANQPLACARCKIPLLSKGPRWWICKDCERECPCDVHPPWAPGDGVV